MMIEIRKGRSSFRVFSMSGRVPTIGDGWVRIYRGEEVVDLNIGLNGELEISNATEASLPDHREVNVQRLVSMFRGLCPTRRVIDHRGLTHAGTRLSG